MKIAIRVDASLAIGLGHIQRCLSLAKALRQCDADVQFVARRLGIDVEALARNSGFPCRLLPAPDRDEAPAPGDVGGVAHAMWAGVQWDVDARETALMLQPHSIDCLIVDHYGFDARWHRHVAGALEARIAVIDDLADRDHAADLLVDHNYAPEHGLKYHGRINGQTRILGGPRYALLDDSYAIAARYRFSEQVRSIGIFLGGTDSENHSALAIRACRDAARFTGPVEIVSTRNNPHLRALEALARQWDGTQMALGLPDLAGFFARHDLQIGAGGGATWERCCIGVPTVAVAIADNQRQVLEPLACLGVLHAMTAARPSELALGKEIRYLIDHPDVRQRMANESRALVDGRGALRVAEEIRRLCNK